MIITLLIIILIVLVIGREVTQEILAFLFKLAVFSIGVILLTGILLGVMYE